MDYPLYQPSSIYGAGSPYPFIDGFLTVLYYVYLAVIVPLMIISLHAYMMVLLRRRLHVRDEPQPPPTLDELPTVCLQVPIYNEGPLAVQAIEAAARVDYPEDKLEIIVLDGSTDTTPALIAPVLERIRARGRRIIHHQRDNSVGYKAGGLAEGVEMTDAELIAIFDADFIPAPSFLRRAVHHFSDPRVGCLQTRWGHRNAGASVLTVTQSVILDSFYGTELPVRAHTGFCTVFTGTCGIWRRECIRDAGGWQWDTLVEDMDLSYRAQLRGWRITYDQSIVTPGELPEDFSAFLRQQHRWTMGHSQVCRKHIGKLLKAPWPLWRKLEGIVQLCRWAAYPLVLAMLILMMPALIINPQLRQMSPLESVFGLLLFVIASGGAAVFYLSGQIILHPRTWLRKLVYMPVILAMTGALAPTCCRAIYRGLMGHKEPFRKTPRVGEAPARVLVSEVWIISATTVVGLYLLVATGITLVAAWQIDAWAFLITAFALLNFAIGLLWAGISGWVSIFRSGTTSAESSPTTTAPTSG